MYVDDTTNSDCLVLRDEFPGFWLLALVGSARCLEKLGERERALESYHEFLRRWGTNASELAAVRQARAHRDRLLGEIP